MRDKKRYTTINVEKNIIPDTKKYYMYVLCTTYFLYPLPRVLLIVFA